MPLIPTAPIKRPFEATTSPRPSKKRKRDDEQASKLIPTATAPASASPHSPETVDIVPIPPTSIPAKAGPQIVPAPTLNLPHPIPPPSKPAKRRTHNRLPPPKPQPNYPVHLSATNPLREQKGIGRARDVIYVTAQTSIGAYLSRCKSLLVDQGINKITLHALAASIPHAMIILHALLDVLPYPDQYVRYELRTSTVECVDEMLIDVEGGGQRGKDKKTGNGKAAKGKANARKGNPESVKGKGVEKEQLAGAKPIRDSAAAGPLQHNGEQDASSRAEVETGGGDEAEDEDEKLLRMMMQGVEGGGGGGEVADAGFRIRSKSALEIVIRIGKPPHNGPPRTPKLPSTTTSSSTRTRFVGGEPVNAPAEEEGEEEEASGTGRSSIENLRIKKGEGEEKRNRPSKASRLRLMAKEKAGHAAALEIADATGAGGGGDGMPAGMDREEEEAMMNAA